jgi:hypothetical protein
MLDLRELGSSDLERVIATGIIARKF